MDPCQAPRDVPRVGRAQQVLRAGEELSCVSWEMVGTKGRWTPEGCFRVGGDPLYSVCACTHFSTFAILVATRPIKVRTHFGGCFPPSQMVACGHAPDGTRVMSCV